MLQEFLDRPVNVYILQKLRLGGWHQTISEGAEISAQKFKFVTIQLLTLQGVKTNVNKMYTWSHM